MPNLYIFKGCVNLINELKGYYWGSGDVPRKTNDHSLDEMRYYLMTRPRNAPTGAALTEIQKDKERLARNLKRRGKIFS